MTKTGTADHMKHASKIYLNSLRAIYVTQISIGLSQKRWH